MITFSRTVAAGYYNEATGDFNPPVVTTISGEAIVVASDPQLYRALSLIESAAPTLLFDDNDYSRRAFTDEYVKQGDTTVFNGKPWTVRDIQVVAPDGFVIIARIVIEGA